MTTYTKINIKFVIALLLLIGTITRPHLGFSAVSGSEGIGFNVATVLIYILGLWLVLSGVKEVRQLRSKKID